jgi:hypothetical protein
VTVGRAQNVQPYLECLAFRLDTEEGRIKAGARKLAQISEMV